MTEHDKARALRAATCDRNDLQSLADAIAGLQSTDDPSLVQLHDDLQNRWKELKEKTTTSSDLLCQKIASIAARKYLMMTPDVIVLAGEIIGLLTRVETGVFRKTADESDLIPQYRTMLHYLDEARERIEVLRIGSDDLTD